MHGSGQPFKVCPQCQASHALDAPACSYCGHQFSTRFIAPAAAKPAPPPGPTQMHGTFSGPSPGPPQPFHSQPLYAAEQKSMPLAILLALFAGGLGVHRLYLGYNDSGITMLILGIVGFVTAFVFIGFFILLIVGIWALVDLIMIATGSLPAADGTPLKSSF